jgi:DNA-binding PadR family transcriptional regulator
LVTVELLQRKGPIVEDDLIKELREAYGDVSLREVNRILMRLEVNGLVRVSRLMKGKRLVELVKSRELER